VGGGGRPRPVFAGPPGAALGGARVGAFAGVVTGEGPVVDAQPSHAVSASQGGL